MRYSTNQRHKLNGVRLRAAALALLLCVLLYPAAAMAAGEPVITAQPSSAYVEEGDTAAFSVSATGTGTLSYQWYKDGQAIDGAVSDSLTVSGAKGLDAGTYTVTVTDSAGGSAASSGAELMVVKTTAVSSFNGPRGLDTDAAGRIYVADHINNMVKRMDADGSNIVTLGSGFNGPCGVAVDESGNIYVADIYNNQVKRMNADGSNIVTLGSGFSYPVDVVVDAAGKIYVAIYTSATITSMDADGGNIVTLASGFQPLCLELDAEGHIYVTDVTFRWVKRMDADGGNMETLWTSSRPAGLGIDAAGNIYVSDSTDYKVYRMDSTGNNIVTVMSDVRCFGLTADAEGNMAISDYNNGKVYIKRLLYGVAYDGNGSTGGSVPTDSLSYASGGTAVVADNSGSLVKPGYVFAGWNTATDGSGTAYAPGSPLTMGPANVTLYAQWLALTPSQPDNLILTGGSITLTPNIAGGAWTFDSEYLSRDGNTFTALKEGTTTVSYALNGGHADYTLSIRTLALESTVPGGSSEGGTVYTGGRFTLAPNVSGGTWTFDSEYLSRDGSTFTALKQGTTTVSYAVGGVHVDYTLSIKTLILESTVPSSSPASGTVYTGGIFTLTPNASGGTWTIDSEYLSRSGNTFTALKEGTTTVSYALGGVHADYALTIQTLVLESTVPGGSSEGGTVYTGGRFTLTPNASGGTWTFDSEYLSRSGNTFTALKQGTTTVSYALGGGHADYTLSIKTLALESTVPSGSSGGATVYTGGRFTLTPSVSGGTWDWDEEFFSATFNSGATFTALKTGTSTIRYTVDGVTVSYEVTVNASELPGTGQDFTWMWVLASAAVIALVLAGLTNRPKRRNPA